MVTFLYHIA